MYKASAPGSLMLLGEYAVLQGNSALVCAVDKRMSVTLSPTSDQRIEIISQGYGHWESDLSHLEVAAPFHFVTACLCQHRKKLKSGCRIEVVSEFSDKVGLGSSAAVTVATLAALFAWLQLPLEPLYLIREARRVIRAVQGLGSGADVAASVLGGLVCYQPRPLAVEKFALSPALTVIYSGSKTPTVEAVKRVREQFSSSPQLFEKLCQAIQHCVKEGVSALRQENWPGLGKIMNIQQGLMQALGVSTPLLDKLIEQLRASPTISGAKISGSGWGDCVLGLGEAGELPLANNEGIQQLKVNVSIVGATCSRPEMGEV